jgi:hypothetical protein
MRDMFVLYEVTFPKVVMQLDAKTCMAEEKKGWVSVEMNQMSLS